MRKKIFLAALGLLFFVFMGSVYALKLPGIGGMEKEKSKEGQEQEPLVVNGDKVEYSALSKEFVASGNVVVIFQDTKLTCDKLSLNAQTKDCQAEGNVRMENEKGIIGGNKISYNFETKRGLIIDSNFRVNPFYGKTEKLDKISDAEFLAYHGYMTTCNFDDPHWRMKTRKMDFFPGDKIQLRDATVYAGKIPFLYLPQYNRSLQDPFMHVQIMPGSKKDWGPFMLSAWRYNLTEDIKGRIYLDYRANFGVAEGFGTNYDSPDIGKGDFKFYYTQERDRSKDVSQEPGERNNFQRYLVRLRHKWDLDEKTNITAEYNKIIDSKRALKGTQFNFLKDYFPREYDKDPQPLSYVSTHRSFGYSSVDFLLQKRVNTWFSQEEKMPEIKYSLPSLKLGESPFFLENNSSYVNLKTKTASPAENDDTPLNQFSTNNKLSLPTKISFINFTPSISSNQIFSDKGVFGSTLDNIFSGGADASTKFYRIFNLNTNFLGLNINGLRHIITPTLSYSYTNDTSSKVNEFDIGGRDSTRSSTAALGLENKLQTKRDNKKVDLFYFLINSAYNFRTTGHKGQLSDMNLKLEFYPYSWLSLYSDAIYKTKQGYFSEANYDLSFNFREERNLSVGQRYKLKGNNETTCQFKWRINPKWKFSLYGRLNRGSDTAAARGLREQEYVITRDLHCWSVDFSFNRNAGHGDTVWCIFRLKAFPELEFEFNKSFNTPRPGTQSRQ